MCFSCAFPFLIEDVPNSRSFKLFNLSSGFLKEISWFIWLEIERFMKGSFSKSKNSELSDENSDFSKGFVSEFCGFLGFRGY